MLNYTKHTLTKVEALLAEQKYIIRYERGSFTSGYCIVEDRRIAILNKFFDTAARINCFLDILSSIEVDESLYNEKQVAFYKQAMKHLILRQEESSEKSKEKSKDEPEAVAA